MLIDPVIRRPLQAEWAAEKARIEAALAAPSSRRGNGKASAQAIYHDFLAWLRAFRVLDPACGSGNFLYVALQVLKDLEHQAGVEAEALGLQREFPQVGPETMLGIEINPYAAELARVSVWIGHIQWTRRHGYAAPSNPVLQPLETIECRDAILTPDGKIAEWPKADVIVGNPPFLGDKAMIGILGEHYTDQLRKAFWVRVPAAVDLVCYWFVKATLALAEGDASRAGLVATQSIRKGANRLALEEIRKTNSIFEAWSDEPWTVEGADVRVSLVCFARDHSIPKNLNGHDVSEIHSDLSSGEADLTAASKLKENLGICFQGPVKVGAFDVSGVTARQWLALPANPNGCTNADVVHPWANGTDIVRHWSDTWIIDFANCGEEEAAFYTAPFAHVVREVKPTRVQNRDRQRRERWWQLGRSGGDLRAALKPLARYIATPRVAKHRIFVWLHPSVLPDTRLVAIAREDNVTFGMLHSRMHECWALAQASRHGVGNDPTYNSETCFETFPFPDGLTPNLPAASYASDPRARAIATAARALVEKRDAWLNPPDLVERVPEIVPGFPDRLIPRNAKAAAILKSRTLTNLYNTRATPEGAWLDNLHRALDEAVAAAYGWPADLSEDETLTRLLQLNQARAARGRPT